MRLDAKVTVGYFSDGKAITIKNIGDRKKSGRGRRRPELLAAARNHFFTRGYLGTTIEMVAREAGFSKRTVYLYFKNKDELFLTVGEEGLLILRERLESLDISGMSVEKAIDFILDVYLRFAAEHPHYFRIIFQEATSEMISHIPEAFRNRLEAHERACLGIVVSITERAIAEGIISGIDPWEVATLFWGTVTGIIFLSLGGSQTVFTRKTREELAKKGVQFLFEGLRKR